jgi:hypothetical protein
LRWLRTAVLGLRHDYRAYAAAAVLSLVAVFANVAILFHHYLFWAAALGGSFAFFATRALDTYTRYRELREEFGNLVMRRIALIMDATDEAAARLRMRRTQEKEEETQ